MAVIPLTVVVGQLVTTGVNISPVMLTASQLQPLKPEGSVFIT